MRTSVKMKCLVLTALLFQSVCSTTKAEISSSKDDKEGRQLYRPQSLWEVILLPDTYFNRRYSSTSRYPQFSPNSYVYPQYTTTNPYLAPYPPYYLNPTEGQVNKRQNFGYPRSGASTTTPAPEASGTERNMVTSASKDPPRSEKGPSKSCEFFK